MQWISRAPLVAAVSEAGGLGYCRRARFPRPMSCRRRSARSSP
ncbi:MAG: hypothetical protein ACLR1P_10070 [Oscillospiraceae bacterium]